MIEEESERLICSLFKINTTIEKMKIDISERKTNNSIARDMYNTIIHDSIDIIYLQSKKINNCLYTNLMPINLTNSSVSSLENHFNNEISSILFELKEDEIKIFNDLNNIKELENLEFISIDLLNELEVHIKSIIMTLSKIAQIMTKMFKNPQENQCHIYLVCKFRFIQILSFRVISELKFI